jgi:hypothetical protein
MQIDNAGQKESIPFRPAVGRGPVCRKRRSEEANTRAVGQLAARYLEGPVAEKQKDPTPSNRRAFSKGSQLFPPHRVPCALTLYIIEQC